MTTDHATPDAALPDRLTGLLADPAQADNPLRPALAEALEHILAQNQRLERLLRIADGYHRLERDQTQTLVERCERQIRRMEKLTRISDRYQRNLLDVTESLRQAANQDALTGLANRRALMERLRQETQRAARKGASLAIALMDVDHFKQINDRFGHEIGDLALREIADAIRQGVRGYDIHGRWGGEEFLLLLPETDAPEAVAILERVRARIGAIVLNHRTLEQETGQETGQEETTPVRLSASFGLTLRRPDESIDATLKRADDALFEAKRQGRDRVALAP